jgi:hypothetical protein
MEEEKYSYGYDAQAGEYGNLVSKGIIDPTNIRLFDALFRMRRPSPAF